MLRGKLRSASSGLFLLLVSLTAHAQSAPSGGGWLSRITDWFKDTFGNYWSGFQDWASDFFVGMFDSVLAEVVTVVSWIGVPDFVNQYSLQSLLGNAGPTVQWAFSTFQLPAGIALVGSAWAFRLLRKLLTLGQW